MKKLLRLAIMTGLISLFSAGSCITALAGTWKIAENHWFYQNEDGTMAVSRWLKDPADGKWYHFNSDGYMETGWIIDRNRCYYLDGTGAMAENTVTPDGYYVGNDGAWIEEWEADTAKTLSGDSLYPALAQEITALVNAERTANGLREVTVSDSLNQAAAVRAKEITGTFSHFRPDGTRCHTVLDDLNIDFTFAGENIAYGQDTPAEVMNDWMESESHRKNILNSRYEEIGVACYKQNGIYYWVQVFKQN